MANNRRGTLLGFLVFVLFFACALPGLGQDFLEKANQDIALGHYDQAVAVLQHEIQNHPRNLKALLTLGNLYFRLRDLRNATAAYEAVLLVDPQNASALNNIGYVYQTEGNIRKAASYYRKSESASPTFIPPRQNLAALFLSIGDLDGAIKEYEALARMDPNGEAPFRLADTYVKKQDYAGAVRTLKAFVERNPRSGLAWQQLAEVYLSEGRNKDAFEASRRALELEPSTPTFLLTGARAAEAAGRLSQAGKEARQVLRLVPAGDPARAQAEKLLSDIHSASLERRQRILVTVIVFLTLCFAAGAVYVWRKGGGKETAYTRIAKKWEEDLEALSDLQEITEFLFGYLLEFFKIPKGMFFLVNRDGTELNCTNTNLKVVLANTIDVNPEPAGKWVRIHQGKPMTVTQAVRSSYFHEAFPNAKEVCEKHDMRLLIPFYEKGKLLALLLLGGITRSEFQRILSKQVRKKAAMAHAFAQKASTAIETAMLYELSVVDEQTKVYNKRFFRQVLLEELKRVERYNQPCSLLMMDIDHFKKLNDTYGHPQGDTVLRELAEILKQNVREGMDSVSRYGGEEFAVILPATIAEKAKETAERIRTSVYNHPFSGLPAGMRVTVSIGVASYPDQANTDWELIKAADQALYKSKKSGRNRVTVMEKDDAGPDLVDDAGNSQAPSMKALPPFHSFQFRFEGEVRRAQSEKYPIAVSVLQIDNFASIGKPDRLLPQLAFLCQPFLRVIDFYSSNEPATLLFMLSEKKAKDAVPIMEQICRKAKATSFYGVNGPVRVSAGVAVFPEDGQTLEDLLSHAQAARGAAAKQRVLVMAYQDVKQPV